MKQDYHENTKNRSAEDIRWIVITEVNAHRVRNRSPEERERPQTAVAYPDQGRQSETEGSMITRKRIQWLSVVPLPQLTPIGYVS